MKSHLTEWGEYKDLSDMEKSQYFKPKRSVNTYFELLKECANFYIRKDIVDVLFFEILLHNISEDAVSRENSVAVLKKEYIERDDEDNENYYMVKIVSVKTFRLVVSIF